MNDVGDHSDGVAVARIVRMRGSSTAATDDVTHLKRGSQLQAGDGQSAWRRVKVSRIGCQGSADVDIAIGYQMGGGSFSAVP